MLNITHVLKQQLNECNSIECNSVGHNFIEYNSIEHIKMVTKQLNIKNRTYYFWNDSINLKDFDPSLLKLDKTLSMHINIYYIGLQKSLSTILIV